MVEKAHTAAGTWWPGLMEPLRSAGERIADFFAPSADAAATGDCYEINVELPGVKVEDIDVTVDDGTLTVKGEKHFEREEKGKTYFFSERAWGSFQRSFRLPPDAKPDDVSADFKDGVLAIRVPKSGPAKERARKVPIG